MMVSKNLISSKMRAKFFFLFNRKKFKVHAFIKDDKKPKEFLSPSLLIYGKYIRLLLCLVFITLQQFSVAPSFIGKNYSKIVLTNS